MSVFHRLMAVADASIDRVNAEAFAFAPMREVVNGRPAADPTRQPGILMAVFDAPAERMTLGANGGADRVTSGPTISVRASLLTDVRRFDRFTRVRDGKVFEVTAPGPDGIGRIVARVVEIAL